MIRTALSLAALALLAPERTEDVEVRAMTLRELQLFVWEGPRNAAIAFRRAEDHLAELPGEELALVRAAAGRVVAGDPYNRATVQLMATLEVELDALARVTGAWTPPAALVDPEAEPGLPQRIGELRDKLRAVAALDRRLGVAPAEPLTPTEVTELFATVAAQAERFDPAARAGTAADLTLVRGRTLALWNDADTLVRAGNLLRDASRSARDVLAGTDHPEIERRARTTIERTTALGNLVFAYPQLFA